MSALTPMMQQFKEIKGQNPGSILLFRLGDFYEMFEEDAVLASRELDLVLTGREAGELGRIPMCGFPYHAANNYITKLVGRGYRVAICEQMEDPRSAKGLVKREIIRIVTPGTLIDPQALTEKKNNYLVAITAGETRKTGSPVYGMAVIDTSTGDFQATEFFDPDALDKLWSEIGRIHPAEILLAPGGLEGEARERLDSLTGTTLTFYEGLQGMKIDDAVAEVTRQYKVSSLEGLGCSDMTLGIIASAGLLGFVRETQKTEQLHLKILHPYVIDQYLIMDLSTRRNLELTSSIRHGSREGSLLGVLDRTVTAMGGRKLRAWLERPLLDLHAIQERLDAVEHLLNGFFMRTRLRELLNEVYDLERLMARIAYGTANARDLVALMQSLSVVPEVKQVLAEDQPAGLLRDLCERLDELRDLVDLISTSIVDEPPLTVREGGIIRTGYNPEVDQLREAAGGGKQWIASLENRERERSGIRSLKVGFNKVFGYYLEVTNPNLPMVPQDYIRKQTLANAERYITPELKEYESMVLGAEDKLVEIEYQLFTRIREAVSLQSSRIQQTAETLAEIDVLCSFSLAASEYGYCKPQLDHGLQMQIKDARHPVVERLIPGGSFVPNDVCLDGGQAPFAIITGPNMGGKSTYCRSVALISLMSQMGSFVPAREAHIGLVDRIYARVGSSDDLSAGQSTFMVEMNEVGNIVNTSTNRSLVVLDEVGRGTSTFDGLSLAWALVEFLHNRVGARSLFATHYHELTDLEGVLPGVRNYSVAVREHGHDIVFLRKLVAGGSDRSYGIQVARLAGLPAEIIDRASAILKELEERDLALGESILRTGLDNLVKARKAPRPTREPNAAQPRQISMIEFDNHPVLEELRNINLVETTPLEALKLLFELQKKVKSGARGSA
ncbi:MAG: DNA mismatch repair protein MutS [Firmicutes bacterium]|nr:DNA mismatch repair protein MutS [Bacillota bacterium]